MLNLPNATPASQLTHWAFIEGKAAGIAGKTAERGLMVFGLSCAGDASTANNTRLWLSGFDAGVTEAKDSSNGAPGSGAQKSFHTMRNVGKVRHLVSYHDGVQRHKDNSPFFDVRCFGRKTKADAFEKELRAAGYVQT